MNIKLKNEVQPMNNIGKILSDYKKAEQAKYDELITLKKREMEHFRQHSLNIEILFTNTICPIFEDAKKYFKQFEFSIYQKVYLIHQITLQPVQKGQYFCCFYYKSFHQ